MMTTPLNSLLLLEFTLFTTDNEFEVNQCSMLTLGLHNER